MQKKNNNKLEYYILGLLMMNADAFSVLSNIKTSFFNIEENKEVFDAILSLGNSGIVIELSTVYKRLCKMKPDKNPDDIAEAIVGIANQYHLASIKTIKLPNSEEEEVPVFEKPCENIDMPPVPDIDPCEIRERGPSYSFKGQAAKVESVVLSDFRNGMTIEEAQERLKKHEKKGEYVFAEGLKNAIKKWKQNNN